MTALDQIARWPAAHASAAVIGPAGVRDTAGDPDHVYRLASIAKTITAWAVLVAVEEGTVSLDDPVGQPGCTLRHLLAHAGGYGFDGHEPAGSDQEFIGHGEAEKKSPAVGAGLGSRVTATGIAFDQFAGLRSVAVMKTRRSGA